MTKTTILLDYGSVSYGKVAVATRLLSRPGPQEYLDAEPSRPWDEQVLPSGQDGTLLAVVPIPGTGTSLAIVGYAIATSDVTTSAVPARAWTRPQRAARRDAAPPGRLAAGLLGAGTPPAGTGDSGLLLDHMQRRVWAGDREIALTFQEFELLSFLTAHPAKVFSRADLVRQVWHHDLTLDGRTVRRDSRTVDVHISRVRQKLGPVYGQCLVTEYRVGYQFRPPAE